MKLQFVTTVPSSLEKVKAGFTKKLFLELTPPGVSVVLERFDGCSPGHEVHLQIGSFGLKQKWVSHITNEVTTEREWFFVDEGKVLPWPLKSWKHIHKVVADGDDRSIIIDDITYGTGHSILDVLMYPSLWISFAVRPSRYKKYFRSL